MLKRHDVNFVENPSFNTVLNLSNRTFDGTNIVTGRGATEDQLLVVHNYLVELEARQEECCSIDWSNPILENIMDKLDDLEIRIEECCASNSCYDGGGNIPSSACDGSEVTVAMTWGTDPATDGAQVTASSSGGAAISYYFFLVKSISNVWIPKTTVNYLDKEYSIDKTTGKISIVTASGAGHQACAILAQDANGCEGVGVFVGAP